MPSNDEILPAALLTRVLGRLALGPAPSPTLAGLTQTYAAWSRSVPFDNIRKLIHIAGEAPGPLAGDNPAEFFEAWLRWGNGGTCWAGNGALCLLLRSLGFDAERGVATMLVAPQLPPNHGTVVVSVDGGRYLVDASMLYAQPLVLDDAASTGVEHPAWGVRCARKDGKWHVRWRPLHMPDGLDCRLDHEGATAAEFSEHHEATRGWSPFNYQVNARRNVGNRVVGLAFGQRIEIDAGGAVTQTPIDDEQRRRILVEEVGIHAELVEALPPDRPTPPPPTSLTARAPE